METLTYVTGNYGKYCSVKRHFEDNGVDVEFFKNDAKEPNINDIEIISRAKVKEAYDILGKPCFVADSGFYIDAYPDNPGYPGAFVKRSGVSSNISKLLEDMKDVKNRKCRFLDCLTFYDGEEYHTFYGVCEGTLAYEIRGTKTKEALSNLWYVFIPNNCSKTLMEMSEEERINRNDGRTSATVEFLKWYKDVYSHNKILKKK